MREPNWKSYIVVTPQPILTPQQCQELIILGQAEPKIEATVSGGKEDKQINNTIRKSQISWIPFNKATTSYKIIVDWMQQANTNFFAFDNMQMNELAQYTEYSKGGFYNWHIDIHKNMRTMPSVRKISMTLLLNDPKEFEGGELEIYNGELTNTGSKEHLIKLKQGQAIFFASFFLHRVNTVTEGNRKALVMWFGGTPFK
jgi:PKHD-type hydroxylase